jgi:preprotein translocase subunit SecA
VEYAEDTVDDIVGANIDLSVPMEEWELEVLAKKMQQYCYLMEDVTEVQCSSKT